MSLQDFTDIVVCFGVIWYVVDHFAHAYAKEAAGGKADV